MNGKTLAILLVLAGGAAALWLLLRGDKANSSAANTDSGDATNGPDSYPIDNNLLYGYCVSVPSFIEVWAEPGVLPDELVSRWRWFGLSGVAQDTVLAFFKAAGVLPTVGNYTYYKSAIDRWRATIPATSAHVTVNSLRCPAPTQLPAA